MIETRGQKVSVTVEVCLNPLDFAFHSNYSLQLYSPIIYYLDFLFVANAMVEAQLLMINCENQEQEKNNIFKKKFDNTLFLVTANGLHFIVTG